MKINTCIFNLAGKPDSPQQWQRNKERQKLTALALPPIISRPILNREDHVTTLENKQNKSLVILIIVSLFFPLFSI